MKQSRFEAQRPGVGTTDLLIIGIVSDTHGLLRREVLTAFRGVTHILHAGDVGDPEILDALASLAPITAIRGNIDIQGACASLPATNFVEVGGKLIYLVHSLEDLDVNPEEAQIDMVVSGHSHQASLQVKRQVLYVNPGSAGPKRFRLPTTIALVEVVSGTLVPRIVEL